MVGIGVGVPKNDDHPLNPSEVIIKALAERAHDEMIELANGDLLIKDEVLGQQILITGGGRFNGKLLAIAQELAKQQGIPEEEAYWQLRQATYEREEEKTMEHYVEEDIKKTQELQAIMKMGTERVTVPAAKEKKHLSSFDIQIFKNRADRKRRKKAARASRKRNR